jgi:hypothetical protein
VKNLLNNLDNMGIKRCRFFFYFFFNSGMEASHPEILFLFTAIVPASPQETVRDAGIEPRTAASQSGATLALSQLSHHIPAEFYVPVDFKNKNLP